MEISTAQFDPVSVFEQPLSSAFVLPLLTLAVLIGFAIGKSYERACAVVASPLQSASLPDEGKECEFSGCGAVLSQESFDDGKTLKLESDSHESISRSERPHPISFYEFMESPRKARPNPIEISSSSSDCSSQPIILELDNSGPSQRLQNFTLHVRLSPRLGASPVTSDFKKSVSKYAELLENGKFSKTFDVISKLGKGGFGTVFLAQHRLDGCEYAVKQIKMQVGVEEDFRSHKLFREVQSMLKLSSKYVTRYITCWIESEQAGLAAEANLHSTSSDSDISESESEHEGVTLHLHIQMEYCAGNTLKEWIGRPDRIIDRSAALNVMLQLLKGVASIHSSHIWHRDLKPENVFLLEDLQVKIGDFGLATEAPELELSDNKSAGGLSTNIGTALYTAPEQLNLEDYGDYDEKVDVYPLGLIFLELIWRFGTAHERMKAFDVIRKSHKLPCEVASAYPLESEMILWLANPTPQMRPSVQEVLDSRLLSSLKDELDLA